jgi:hypothetical protein
MGMTSPFQGDFEKKTVTVNVTAVSGESQQVVKGLGGGMPWPGAGSGFPITNHADGMKTLLDMGISVARIYWHNQYLIFDENGDPTEKGQILIDGILEEVRWLNEHNIPYNLDGGINSMPRFCYKNYTGGFNGKDGFLLPEYEPAFIKTNMHVLNAILEAELEMPLMFTPFNEPSAPIEAGKQIDPAMPDTGSMPREQCVRLSKMMRQAMDEAGFKDIQYGYSQQGEPVYTNWYAGDDINGSSIGSMFTDVVNGEKFWPFFNPASPRYDAELDAAVGCFSTHSYWPSVPHINQYRDGYNATAKGRDNWQAEYCPSTELIKNYNLTTIRKFISDMVFFKFNYWEYWNIWNTSSRPASDSICARVDGVTMKPGVYYVFKKIFNNITPGETYVRRLNTDGTGLQVTDDINMDAAAFVSADKTVVVLVNNNDNATDTNLCGLYGNSAEVYQINGANTVSPDNMIYNTDMTLVDTPNITDGIIDYISLPGCTITVIVTNGGYGVAEVGLKI